VPEADTASVAPDRDPFRVSSRNDPKKLASAVTKCIGDGHYPVLKAVGHGAVGQAVKALAIARVYLGPAIDLAFTVEFQTVPDEKKGGDMSLMIFSTFQRHG
jgi:stage V sporulation protein S